jgi:hypothetical protein
MILLIFEETSFTGPSQPIGCGGAGCHFLDAVFVEWGLVFES